MKMVNGLADLYDRAYFPNQPEPSDAEYADAKQERARCEKKSPPYCQKKANPSRGNTSIARGSS